MDNFSVHCTHETNDSIAAFGTKVMMLPPNTTHKSQPLGKQFTKLDVGINKSFKDQMRHLFMNFLVLNNVNDVENHNGIFVALEKITRVHIAKWIWESWEHCRRMVDISRTLRKIGYMVPN